jgi:hypothetical protein
MEPILYIAYQAGCHGNFLKFFLDKFSKLTPELNDLPFDSYGTSHKKINYSKKFINYHPFEHCESFFNENTPHCLITIDKKDLLFLQRMVYQRPANLNIKTNEDYIKFPEYYFKYFTEWKNIENLYKNDFNNQCELPKFVLRDFLKMGFLDKDNNGYIKKNSKYFKNNLKNVYYMPLSSFWEEEEFLIQIKNLDKKFHLELDFNKIDEMLEIYKLFIKNLKIHDTKNRCDQIIDAIENKQDLNVKNLDVIEQAYIYAWIELKYTGIITPFTNSFFESTKDINSYIIWFPNFYKMVNPHIKNNT